MSLYNYEPNKVKDGIGKFKCFKNCSFLVLFDGFEVVVAFLVDWVAVMNLYQYWSKMICQIKEQILSYIIFFSSIQSKIL